MNDPYCTCGHAIVSHNPARDDVPCCIGGCDCTRFIEREKAQALAAMDEIVADYFAFQAVVCTTQADCQCGRH